MIRLVLVLLALTSTLLVGANRVAARCASPHVATSPVDGAAVPPDPTIYLFIPHSDGIADLNDRIRVLADGKRVSARVEQAGTPSGAFSAVRVTVDTDAQRRLTIRYREGREESQIARFAIDRSWSAPARRPVELASAEYRKDQWTCSFTDAWFLEIPTQADAFRVEWATSPDAWDRGAQTVAFFPRTEMDFWPLWGKSPSTRPAPGSIGLGYLNCFGATIPVEAVRGPLHVKVTALFADGSESPSWAEPRRLGDAPAPATDPVTTQPTTTVPPAPAALVSSAPPVLPPGRSTAAFAAASAALIALSLAIAGALVARSRHRRGASRLAPPPR
jgi:hypothetical protein